MPAYLETLGEGKFIVRGELDFGTVEALWQQANGQFQAYPSVRIDLSAVDRADSAGVALLVEWLREAKARGQSLQFVNTPAQMLAIFRVTDLEDLLPLT